MTKEQTIEAIKVMQAFVDGKEVEINGMLADSVWLPAGAPCWNWQMMEYRIKSVSVLRPWTADEVPLGAQMRRETDPKFRWLILNVGNDDMRMDFYLKNEHSIDKGVTWLPCGVMEEAK
jgi:hypothetical protein